MSSLKKSTYLFLIVLGWMWIYRLPDGSALADVKDDPQHDSAAQLAVGPALPDS